ncbi:YegS/Rv2252/BmrU family lipid kinase [Clostridium fallax]|uniref:Lipid kinase, YegS/Rv2252/BmrU family n=1 Tax=Clostridium fallax TaxID=1533 RepID=A0A1M4SSA5_9CLOT|nr:YegS/Rv2252/BmrU family lipid kinase [Clostridium fallax]SHE35134.1 lipid kinase, YegS/Rv2252/BmrU family [Clostridium fallax]SQB07948.1 lipid kinase [Clostridium fallax]
MKKVKFIYNPYSGENLILNEIDTVIRVHQKYGYQVIVYRIERGKDLGEAFDDNIHVDYVLVAGGDGTVDTVVNKMKERNLDIPIGILPVGTANDFSKFLGIPNNVEKACIQILESEPKGVDVSSINDKYFINVASTGLFTDVSQKTDDHLKNTIGKLAYYLKGIEQLPNFRSLKVKITSKEVNFDGYMYLMLVFNGQTAGNFKLATEADAMDGKLDVIVFKAVPIKELLPLFIKVLKGEHLEEKDKVLYFKTSEIKIESNEDIVTDIDGEKGPDFPIEIKCHKAGIKVLGIK